MSTETPDTAASTAGSPAPAPGLHLFNIMAKPVCGVCNLDCTYCYYTEKLKLYPGVTKFMMSDALLETYVQQYMAAQPQQVYFGWQGGEPTLAGLDFFRRAVELQKAHGRDGQVVSNALQTNGTLLDDEWCAFLAEHKFLVGLSLDGPAAWHDHFRRDGAGKPSHARSWKGLELLRKHGVEFNVLVTLNSRNAPYAGDIYRYFVNRGVHWLQFIPILERNAAGEPEDYSCSARQFGKFLCDVFDAWAATDVGRVSVRLFDSLLHTVIYGEATVCCESKRCATAHVLEFNGDLYACDHFVEPEWLLGNINETPLAELVTSPRLDEFARLKTELPGPCRDCEFLFACNGGCPKHHLGAAADSPERRNHFCQGYQEFFRYALPELRRMAEYVKKGQLPPPRNGLVAPDGQSPLTQRRLQERPHAMPDKPPGRNDPCPCGSGRKFKLCCGRH